MAQAQPRTTPPPATLICYGARRAIAESISIALAPKFTFTAIVSEWTINSESDKLILTTLLKHLHPPPAGVLVGGAFDDAKKQNIKDVVDEYGLKFVGVPYMYMRDHSKEETMEWIRGKLGEEFGGQ
jgi:hypothetical protein